jgi:hypothetical protein
MHLFRLADPLLSKLGIAPPIAVALVLFVLASLRGEVENIGRTNSPGPAGHGVTLVTPVPPHFTPTGDRIEYAPDVAQEGIPLPFWRLSDLDRAIFRASSR